MVWSPYLSTYNATYHSPRPPHPSYDPNHETETEHFYRGGSHRHHRHHHPNTPPTMTSSSQTTYHQFFDKRPLSSSGGPSRPMSKALKSPHRHTTDSVHKHGHHQDGVSPPVLPPPEKATKYRADYRPRNSLGVSCRVWCDQPSSQMELAAIELLSSKSEKEKNLYVPREHIHNATKSGVLDYVCFRRYQKELGEDPQASLKKLIKFARTKKNVDSGRPLFC
eukprot:PhF_6_TR16589/c0_g1_i1/m.25279